MNKIIYLSLLSFTQGYGQINCPAGGSVVGNPLQPNQHWGAQASSKWFSRDVSGLVDLTEADPSINTSDKCLQKATAVSASTSEHQYQIWVDDFKKCISYAKNTALEFTGWDQPPDGLAYQGTTIWEPCDLCPVPTLEVADTPVRGYNGGSSFAALDKDSANTFIQDTIPARREHQNQIDVCAITQPDTKIICAVSGNADPITAASTTWPFTVEVPASSGTGYYQTGLSYTCSVGTTSPTETSVTGITACSLLPVSPSPAPLSMEFSESDSTAVADLSTWFGAGGAGGIDTETYKVACTQNGETVTDCPYNVAAVGGKQALVRATPNTMKDVYTVQVSVNTLCGGDAVSSSPVEITHMSGSYKTAIVLYIVGGIVGFALIGGLVWYCVKKRGNNTNTVEAFEDNVTAGLTVGHDQA